MGSKLPVRLPVIDFTEDLESGTLEWDLVKSQVRQALQDYGCFEALFHKFPRELRNSMFEATEEVFHLPLQAKRKNVTNRSLQGYVGQYPMLPLLESIGIQDPNILQKVEALANNFWPQGNASFSNIIQAFSDELSKFDHTIRRIILESFGLEKYMDKHLSSTDYLLRILKYEAPKTSEKKVGAKVHRDKNIVTILHQLNEVNGLEIQTKDGEWVSVNPSSNSFIVLIGDSLHAWLNGRLHCPSHRVMMSGNKARYSTALFSVLKEGCIVKAPDELVDEQHPLLFKPFDYEEFARFYRTEGGQKAESALEAFCGV